MEVEFNKRDDDIFLSRKILLFLRIQVSVMLHELLTICLDIYSISDLLNSRH